MSPPTSGQSEPAALTVIVPAFNCPGVLRACLDGLLASELPRTQWELIVVDDSSTDNTPAVARACADRVMITRNGPHGPAEARNLGATVASAPVLLFIDADVVVSPQTLSGYVKAFEAHPEVAAIFGSYDDTPADKRFLSQYRNLLHYYVHTENAGEASTFWAGCGAVRRAVFLEVGGYDAVRYPRPQIEDIDLGYRLRARGSRILLAPELQGKHLKRWTFRNLVRTDLRDRAIPWMHLLIDRREAVADGPLNLKIKEKVLTALSGVVALLFLVALVTLDIRWLAGAILGSLVIAAGNASMLVWFARQRGVLFALGVVPMRLLFYILSGTGALWAMLSHRFQPAHATLPPLRDQRDRVVAA